MVLFASLLFAAQSPLARSLSTLKSHRTRHSTLFVGTFLVAVYGGYFGAGLGIMLFAVLGLTLSDTLARSNGMRSVLSALVNGVAAAIFVVRCSIAWSTVAVLVASALGGGWTGARIARRLPAPVLRAVVVVAGVTTFAPPSTTISGTFLQDFWWPGLSQ